MNYKNFILTLTGCLLSLSLGASHASSTSMSSTSSKSSASTAALASMSALSSSSSAMLGTQASASANSSSSAESVASDSALAEYEIFGNEAAGIQFDQEEVSKLTKAIAANLRTEFGILIEEKLNPQKIRILGNSLAGGVKPQIIQALNKGIQNGTTKVIRVMHKGACYVVIVGCILGVIYIMATQPQWNAPYVILSFGALCAYLESQNALRPLLKQLFKVPQDSVQVQAAREKRAAERKTHKANSPRA